MSLYHDDDDGSIGLGVQAFTEVTQVLKSPWCKRHVEIDLSKAEPVTLTGVNIEICQTYKKMNSTT